MGNERPSKEEPASSSCFKDSGRKQMGEESYLTYMEINLLTLSSLPSGVNETKSFSCIEEDLCNEIRLTGLKKSVLAL